MNVLLSQKELQRRDSVEKDRVSSENIHSVATLKKKKFRNILKRINALRHKYVAHVQPIRAPRVTSQITPSTPRDCFNDVTLKNRGFRAFKLDLGVAAYAEITVTVDQPSLFDKRRQVNTVPSRENILQAARYLGFNNLDEYKIQFCKRVLKYWEAQENEKLEIEKSSNDIAWKVSLREVFDTLQLSVDNFTKDDVQLFNALPGLIFGGMNVATWHTRSDVKSTAQSRNKLARKYVTYPLKEYIIFNADPDWCLYSLK